MNSHLTRKRTILFVDDEEPWRVIFEKTLSNSFDLLVAKNADEGWLLLKKHANEIALIVSDQRMPGRPGLELLKQARAYYPDIIRVLSTGFSDTAVAMTATNQGAVFQYISKPWSGDELLNVVQKAMNFYEVRQERDHLIKMKLSSIRRMELESKIQSLLVWNTANRKGLNYPNKALSAYLDSIVADPANAKSDTSRLHSRSTEEMSAMLSNIGLVEKLSLQLDVLSELTATEVEIDLPSVLSTVRDNFEQISFSLISVPSQQKDKLSEANRCLADSLGNLLQEWIGDLSETDSKRKSLELIETQGCYKVSVVFSDDTLPFVAPQGEGFNGVNLPIEMEYSWLAFLIFGYHLRCEITPIFLSDSRILFEISKDPIEKIEDLEAKVLVARMIEKFETWNFSDSYQRDV